MWSSSGYRVPLDGAIDGEGLTSGGTHPEVEQPVTVARPCRILTGFLFHL